MNLLGAAVLLGVGAAVLLGEGVRTLRADKRAEATCAQAELRVMGENVPKLEKEAGA